MKSTPVHVFEIVVDGVTVAVAEEGLTLLDVLREQLGVRSVKDGCSPQGQCGCCTVLVDGEVVLRDGQLTRVDKQALFREIRGALDRPLTAQEEERREIAALVEPYLRRFYSGTVQQDLAPFTAYNSRS